MSKAGAPLLEVRNLKTYFHTEAGTAKAVDGVDFDIFPGEVLGLVGESGSGKTVTSLSILRLLPQPGGRIVGGRVVFEGRDLVQLSESEMRRVRGRGISMILQDPMTSLNPVYTIGNQVGEGFRFHPDATRDRRSVAERVVEVLRHVRIPAAAARVRDYPHQLSGGMRQRVVAAIALACRSQVMIADEPTTALDVTVQAQFLQLLRDMQRESGFGVLYITHDLGVVAEICDRVAVMYAGRIVESGTVREIFKQPRHPYTRGLINAVPLLGQKRDELFTIPGQPPDVTGLPPGCSFAPRCDRATEKCHAEFPPAQRTDGGAEALCWYPADTPQRGRPVVGHQRSAGHG
jgi:oligopeptide/dipeptide ABC transporter ATP-binding protein